MLCLTVPILDEDVWGAELLCPRWWESSHYPQMLFLKWARKHSNFWVISGRGQAADKTTAFWFIGALCAIGLAPLIRLENRPRHSQAVFHLTHDSSFLELFTKSETCCWLEDGTLSAVKSPGGEGEEHGRWRAGAGAAGRAPPSDPLSCLPIVILSPNTPPQSNVPASRREARPSCS